MSVPSIEKLTALEPWTVVGVRAGDLLDCLAIAADAVAAAQAQLAEARADVATWRQERDQIVVKHNEAHVAWRREQGRADRAEGRLDVARAAFDWRMRPDAPGLPIWVQRAAAALASAPQPEPDLLTAAGGFCVPLFPQPDGSVKVGRATAPQPEPDEAIEARFQLARREANERHDTEPDLSPDGSPNDCDHGGGPATACNWCTPSRSDISRAQFLGGER